MPESLDILKLRALLCFVSEEPSRCTVTGIAEILGEHKQKISRLLMSLEKEGLIDRSNPRRPALTEKGSEKAAYYGERTNIVLNHLLYEGLDIDHAEHDAYAWALFSSDEGMKIIRDSEQLYHAKYELRRQQSFGGETLCGLLGDGEYRFPFLIYREQMKNGSNLSMANSGFEHPCMFIIKNGVGTVSLRAVNVTAKSQQNGMLMRGYVRTVEYLGSDGAFYEAEQRDSDFLFPASALSFLNMGQGIGQVLHGSVCLRMQCSVGTGHMPESTAIFTIII